VWCCLVILGLSTSSANADFTSGVRDAARGDYQSARREYFEAAMDGNEKAQNNLANLYRDGLGGTIDMEQAFYWFSKAAHAGQVNAQTSLGDMFEKGDAVARNYLTAAYWYRRAATSGFFIGQLSLAEMLEAGRGIPRDDVAALAWYTIASHATVNPANQYYVEERRQAVEAMNALAGRFSTTQRSVAQYLVIHWVVGYDLPDRRPPAPAVSVSPPQSPPRPETTKGEIVLATGTGFIVNDRGDVVTNNHVIAGCARIRFGLNGHTLVQGALVAADVGNDIAVANFSLQQAKTASFSNTIRNRPGDDLLVFGYPLLGLLSTSGNLTRGYLTATTGLKDDARYMQISAPVQPGNSGGPVLDMDGDVIGMVTYKLDALTTMKAIGDVPQNVNFALKDSMLRLFLDRHAIPYIVSDHSASLAAAEIGERAEQFTGVVVCLKE
jgi:S1-C subfamily serine protease